MKTFILEQEIDVVCLSESWERQDLSIEEALNLGDNYRVISNPFVRRERVGRPAIIVNTNKFDVEDPGISPVWGV